MDKKTLLATLVALINKLNNAQLQLVIDFVNGLLADVSNAPLQLEVRVIASIKNGALVESEVANYKGEWLEVKTDKDGQYVKVANKKTYFVALEENGNDNEGEDKKPEPEKTPSARIPNDNTDFQKPEPLKKDVGVSIRPLFKMKSIAFGGISKRAQASGATKVRYEIRNGKFVALKDGDKVKNEDNVRTYWRFSSAKKRDEFFKSQSKFCKENGYEMAIEKC